MKIENVELTQTCLWYAIETDEGSFTVENIYDEATGSYENSINNTDGKEVTASQAQELLKAIKEV